MESKALLHLLVTCARATTESQDWGWGGWSDTERHWHPSGGQGTVTCLNACGSSVFSVGVTDIMNIPLVCREEEILDHSFGVTPSCTSLRRWVTGNAGAHGEICCPVDFLCSRGLQKQYPKEQRLQVKQTSLTIVRKISRHIISCKCRIPDLIIMKEVAVMMFLAEKGMKVLPCSWKHNLLL